MFAEITPSSVHRQYRATLVAVVALFACALPVIHDAEAGAASEGGGANRVVVQDLPEPGQAPASPGAESIQEAPAAREKRQVVVIDPGHGGSDPGEIAASGAREKEIVLRIAQVTAELIGDTYDVILTRRSDDTTLSDEQRASDANFRRGDVFISLHAGASNSASANGFQVFVPLGTSTTPAGRTIAGRSDSTIVEDSRRLAQQLAASTHATTSATSRGIYSAPCRVFNGLTMPAALIEVGFLTNPVEVELLASEDYQRAIAEGIAGGIRAYLTPPR
jgi:N-acetylmuramoyl-L-alanine amidase